MHRRHLMLQGIALLGLAATAACAQPLPYPAVPELRREPMLPPPPMPERYVWQPGHWHWDGRGYEWIAGHWVLRPARGEVWEHGRWVMGAGGWTWLPGHWR